MSNIVENVYCLDVRELINNILATISPFLKKEPKEQVLEMSIIVERMVNDLVTRLTHWAANDLYIDTDSYLPSSDPKEITVESNDKIFDSINNLLHILETEIDGLDMFPTWGYPTVKVIEGNVVIIITGDYRIDDWMRQHQKRLHRKQNEVYRLVPIQDE